ncbi:hypothetical protein CONLIGDRAFT_694088 [Coniochaeta ligniaria NRRL 30616]|uniref:Uncharacterized protein n=1 Tax=Coniochaeta ligniaria NRRL 30616 TaxID=1408157 RepID=A0A1J7IPT9_9PEZI|nr:hypothetical protein CONLIGDRAFT_694088 [Coniochaeta ligniaria NRRL 30616]
MANPATNRLFGVDPLEITSETRFVWTSVHNAAFAAFTRTPEWTGTVPKTQVRLGGLLRQLGLQPFLGVVNRHGDSLRVIIEGKVLAKLRRTARGNRVGEDVRDQQEIIPEAVGRDEEAVARPAAARHPEHRVPVHQPAGRIPAPAPEDHEAGDRVRNADPVHARLDVHIPHLPPGQGCPIIISPNFNIDVESRSSYSADGTSSQLAQHHQHNKNHNKPSTPHQPDTKHLSSPPSTTATATTTTTPRLRPNEIGHFDPHHPDPGGHGGVRTGKRLVFVDMRAWFCHMDALCARGGWADTERRILELFPQLLAGAALRWWRCELSRRKRRALVAGGLRGVLGEMRDRFLPLGGRRKRESVVEKGLR